MRLILSMLLLASPALAGYGPMALMREPSSYGDARYGSCGLIENDGPGNMFRIGVTLPAGNHDGFTVCTWARIVSTVQSNPVAAVTSFARWCPDPQRKDAPDLLAGAGGFWNVGGTNLTDLGGAITVASFPWQSYTAAHLGPASNKWSKGVYTIAGWASNAVTVSLGGTDYVVGPGAFNRNAEPGVADSVVISGSGLVSVGISQTPCYRYFQEVDGVNNGGSITGGAFSNGIAFVSWRFSISGTNQLYRSDLGDLATYSTLGQTRTNAAPLNGRFSGDGHYVVGFISPAVVAPYDIDLFDSRVLPWCLTDAELERVHNNGATEVQRRGIPQWR